MGFVYKEEHGLITGACLNVTDACNLACQYCFVAQKPNYMTLDIAKDCVEFLWANRERKIELGLADENAKIFVTYFGGEPTLLWDSIIVPLTLWANEKFGDKISYSMTTNGVLLTADKVDFMYEQGIFPHLSFDGDKLVQDTNRPSRDGSSSFDSVMANVPYLLYKFPNVCFRGTIQESTVQHTLDSYIFAAKTGFNQIYLTPNARAEWSEAGLVELSKQAANIVSAQMKGIEAGLKVPRFSLVDTAFKRAFEYDAFGRGENEVVERTVFRCGLGTTGCSFGYDGSIYGCQEQTSNEKDSYFHIGDIYNGIDTEKHSRILADYSAPRAAECSKPEACNNCPLAGKCDTAHCPSVNLDNYENLITSPYVNCLWKVSMFVEALKLGRSAESELTVDYLKNGPWTTEGGR